MPKVGPNKVNIDPKAYAARVTRAKKAVAAMDPAMKSKIKDMYPKVTKAEAAKQAIGGRKVSPEQKRMQPTPVKKAAAKPATKKTGKK
jgi:hypothetical protein